MTPVDLGLRVELSTPVLSPDGAQIAVVAARANYATDRYDQLLLIVNTATGERRELHWPHPPGASTHASAPRWSPAGDRLAFLDGDSKQQILVASTSTHRTPVRVTKIHTGIQSFEWSPDGRSIAFVAPDPDVERPGDERHNRSFEVVDNDYLATKAPVSSHLWLVPANGGTPRRLTSGTKSVRSIAWLPDGESIVFVSQPRPYDGEFVNASSANTALEAVSVAGDARTIVPAPARIVSSPKPGPSAGQIAYLRFRGPEPWDHPKNAAIVASNGGETHDATTIDRDITDVVWMPDGKTFVVTAPDGPRSGLWLQSLDSTVRQLHLGAVTRLTALTTSATGALAFIGTEARRPSELYFMSSATAVPRRVTNFNIALTMRELGHSETIRWQLDGYEETGVVVYPPGFTKEQKAPLVVHLHGGPEDTSMDAFDLYDELMAAHGWVVFKPNYRGTNSQGDAFQRAIIDDPGDGPGRDVMAGIDALKARGFIDEGRIAVCGASYGGYMTAWLTSHYPVWSSAVMMSSLTTYLDWYTLSGYNVWADPTLGGSPWLADGAARYWRYSPIAYAGQVKAPTLILANTRDHAVPITNSYHFYHALRDNGVPVKFVVYPIEGHSPPWNDPVHERDALRRWITWIDDHFRKAAT